MNDKNETYSVETLWRGTPYSGYAMNKGLKRFLMVEKKLRTFCYNMLDLTNDQDELLYKINSLSTPLNRKANWANDELKKWKTTFKSIREYYLNK